jgi:crossover junction endodeoxyribonuclease RusA
VSTVVELETVSFVVVGVAVAQGSKRAFVTPAGPRVVDANEKRLWPWRAAVAAEARGAMRDRLPLRSPIWLRATFAFTRPAGHFGSGRNRSLVRPSAPPVPGRPDLDKLVRALLDALTGVVFVDDAQVVELVARKRYAGRAETFVEVSEWQASSRR